MKVILHTFIALLDDIVILGIVVLALWFFNVRFSPPIIIVLALVFGGRVFMTYRAAKQSVHRGHVTGSEAMIGLYCEVTETLKPAGFVKVGIEQWKAKSIDNEDIEIGAEVEIVRLKGLTLEVRRKG